MANTNTDNRAAWVEWVIKQAKYSERLNEMHYIELDREIKKSHTYIVEIIPVMEGRIDLGNGNYVRSSLHYDDVIIEIEN